MSVMGGDWGLDIDLTDNEISSGSPRLTTGVYDVESFDAEMKTNGGKKMIVVKFRDLTGHGQSHFNFNIVNPSAEATRIGRDQLKTFLTYGGHPNPDKPSEHPLALMNGLRLRISVVDDGFFVKDNKEIQSYKIGRFMQTDPNIPAPGPSAVKANASGAAASAASAGKGSSSKLNDDIPF